MTKGIRPQLVFHIGDPKTGTSSIQHVLEKKLVNCATRTLSAWTHGDNRVNAIPLASSVRPSGAARQDMWFGGVVTWLNEADFDYGIISAEAFAAVDPRRLHQALVKYLPDYADNVRVVAYVRPHASRFLAAFIQRSKVGQYLGEFDTFLPTIMKQETINYMQRFGLWRDVFGDRFVLRPFVRNELRGQDSVIDFFTEVLGDEPFTVSETVQKNTSPNLRTLAGLHMFHNVLNDAGAKYRVRSNIAKIILDAKPLPGAAARANPMLDRATVEKLIDIYRNDAKAVDEAFFSRPLLSDSLEGSIRSAEDKPIDLNPKNHFGPAELARLEGLIKRMGKIVSENQKVWSAHFQNNRGRVIPESGRSGKQSKSKRQFEKVDTMLSKMTDILR